jgi:DNA-binding response OmpR family regulator
MSNAPVRVLIVDGQPNILITLEFLFAQHGYSVSIAHSGEEALEHIGVSLPHIVVMETVLPYRNGFEICQLIRQKHDSKSMRIILLSARCRDVDIAKGLALGADAFIAKPFSTKHLMETMQSLRNDQG